MTKSALPLPARDGDVAVVGLHNLCMQFTSLLHFVTSVENDASVMLPLQVHVQAYQVVFVNGDFLIQYGYMRSLGTLSAFTAHSCLPILWSAFIAYACAVSEVKGSQGMSSPLIFGSRNHHLQLSSAHPSSSRGLQ